MSAIKGVVTAVFLLFASILLNRYNLLSPSTTSMTSNAVRKGSVYFVSHGVRCDPCSSPLGVILTRQGPPTLFDTASKPYQAWKTIGQDIIKRQPKGLVVVSAHWENDQGGKGVKGMLPVLMMAQKSSRYSQHRS